jgi:hypothetical protein
VSVHHLATDAISMRLLLDELWTAYGQAAAQRPISLPAPAIGIAAYARQLAAAVAAGHFLSELPYWRSVLQPTADLLVRITPEPARRDCTVRHRVTSPLPDVTTGAAVEAALLAALLSTLAAESPRSTLIVEREGHGRDGLPFLDVSRTMGWFTAIHPLRLDSTDPARIRETLARLPSGGVGYGALTWSGGRTELQTGGDCWVAFNYLGRLSGGIDAPYRLAADPSGGDQDKDQPRPRPLSVEAWQTDDMLVVEWIADRRLDLCLTDLVPRHATTVLRMLRQVGDGAEAAAEAAAFALDAGEMAALLDDLSPIGVE